MPLFPRLQRAPRLAGPRPAHCPGSRGLGINVAGFLRHDSADFHAFSTSQSLISADIGLFFDDFCHRLVQPTVVVLDNASTHRSAAFRDRLPYWESQGLTLFYLPPYSPELNRIEILRRCCKHQWLQLNAYTGFAAWTHELRTMFYKIEY